MNETPDSEPQYVAGMRIQPGHRLPRVDPTEQRVLGIPRSWYRTEPVDLTGLRHPIRWTKWRISAFRRGPYAPGFKESMDPPPMDRPEQ
jgi:hypothetical protein